MQIPKGLSLIQQKLLRSYRVPGAKVDARNKMLERQKKTKQTKNCDTCFKGKKYGANVKNNGGGGGGGWLGKVTSCKLVVESLLMKLKFKFQ